jgi:PII-like signaling protein
MKREENTMNGFQITFFTQQDRRHHGKLVAHWLMELAKALDIHGATMIGATEGFGHHGRFHSVHFFDMADQPIEIVMAVTVEEAEQVFARLRAEKIRIVYAKTPVEFGILGEEE